jgi:flavin reductase (DIM6/NTAB) family NADH-FMN oxidoreductase RutF
MSGSIAALFKRLTQGVYVVGVTSGETRDAFTAAWVMQVSYDPLLLALSINANHSSYWLLKEGRLFSVNVLKKDQLDLADRYGRPARADKLVLTDFQFQLPQLSLVSPRAATERSCSAAAGNITSLGTVASSTASTSTASI